MPVDLHNFERPLVRRICHLEEQGKRPAAWSLNRGKKKRKEEDGKEKKKREPRGKESWPEYKGHPKIKGAPQKRGRKKGPATVVKNKQKDDNPERTMNGNQRSAAVRKGRV